MATTRSAAPDDRPTRQPRSGWVDVDTVRDPDGVMAVISRRVAGPPVHTVAIFKVYEQDGEEQKSVFFRATKQGQAAMRVLTIALRRATELEQQAFAALEQGRR